MKVSTVVVSSFASTVVIISVGEVSSEDCVVGGRTVVISPGKTEVDCGSVNKEVASVIIPTVVSSSFCSDVAEVPDVIGSAVDSEIVDGSIVVI